MFSDSQVLCLTALQYLSNSIKLTALRCDVLTLLSLAFYAATMHFASYSIIVQL